MTSSTHLFPSGSFTVRDVKEVPERLRRPVTAALIALSAKIEQATFEEQEAADLAEAEGRKPRPEKTDTALIEEADAVTDLAVLALVTSWTLEMPVTLASLGDLAKGDYDALRAVISPLAWELMPDFTPTPESDTPSTP